MDGDAVLEPIFACQLSCQFADQIGDILGRLLMICKSLIEAVLVRLDRDKVAGHYDWCRIFSDLGTSAGGITLGTGKVTKVISGMRCERDHPHFNRLPAIA